MRTYLDVPTESLTEVLNILEQQLGARLSQLNRSPFDGAQEADSYYTIDGEQGGADGWNAITVYSMENPSMEFLQQKGLELRMDPCFTKSIPRQLTVHVNAQQRLENGGNALDRVRELLMMNGFAERE
jgi:hypothetical protein